MTTPHSSLLTPHSSPCDLAPDYVRAISPYVPGKPISEVARELGLTDIVKLASNENPRGASPAAVQAVQDALAEIARYPDGSGFDLKLALAAHYNVVPEEIVLGNGSNDVLELAARAFLTARSSAIYSQHAFAVYPLATQATGACGIEVAAQSYGHDLSAMRGAIRDDTRMVFIANPNNPTGTLVDAETLHLFLADTPSRILVVLDEAYREYLPAALAGDSVAWLAEYPNLIITRTFSKAYGLAGLRVGFALADAAIADLMNRVRQPFNVSNVAQAAALAALKDQDFVRDSRRFNDAGMTQIVAGLKRLGIVFIPSHGNFVSFEVDDAARVYRRLLESGVIVRPLANYGMPRHLRVSVGLETENAKFLEALALAVRD